ncbi:MAG: phage tail protein [Candidatus Gastranaerophilaceae bacterium]
MDLQKLKTTYCETKEAECLIEGKPLDIGYIVVGDGNGSTPLITKDMKSLVNQKLKLKVSIDDSQKPKYKITADIPEDVEFFSIRELGITDKDGKLLYVSQMDGTSTNLINNGILKQLRLQIIFAPADGVNVIVIDPTVINASVDYCTDNFQKINEKAKPLGYAPLDDKAKIPEIHLPEIDISSSISLRNYIKSCATDADGNPALLQNIGEGTLNLSKSIKLGTDTSNTSYINSSGFFYVDGDGENTQNYDQTYTLNEQITNVQSVTIGLQQAAAHRAGSNIYAYAVFSDGETLIGSLVGGGDSGQTNTFTIQVENRTLTAIRITAYSSAWSNGYAYRYANTTSDIVVNYLQATSSGIQLNVSADNPLIYVSSDGKIKTIKLSNAIDFSSGYTNGVYYIFTDDNIQIQTTQEYTLSRKAPTSPVAGNMWLDMSKDPNQLKKYSGTAWEDYEGVLIGNVTIKDNAILSFNQPQVTVRNSLSYIVETYTNGTSWYRVYSDGWCEQGGQYGVASATGVYTFLKPFKNTNYTICANPIAATGGTGAPIFNWINGDRVYNFTETGFTYGSYNGGTTLRNFYVCGYAN